VGEARRMARAAVRKDLIMALFYASAGLRARRLYRAGLGDRRPGPPAGPPSDRSGGIAAVHPAEIGRDHRQGGVQPDVVVAELDIAEAVLRRLEKAEDGEQRVDQGDRP